MSNKVKIVAVFIMLAFSISMFFYMKSARASQAYSCNQSLWDHVYNPERLEIIRNCTTVTGTVEGKRKERDGDYHIKLRLDKKFSSLINENNTGKQNGTLVLEPICQNEVSQESAVEACRGFYGKVWIPKTGQHVSVTGSYVFDREHGWMEIHPVTSISPL